MSRLVRLTTLGVCLCLVAPVATLLKAAETDGEEKPSPASSDTSEPSDGRGDAPRPSGLREEVVVTANRLEQPADRVGSTISVITREQLERRQYHYVVDALRDVPGVDVRSSGGPGANVSIFMRGADSDHTLVLVDGVEINDPSSPSRLPILAQLTTDDVDRIEVLRGPQSTLYGADAIGGVIQIFTRRGSGSPTTRIGGEGGSYANRRAWMDSEGGNARLRYSVGASVNRLDGFSAMPDGVEDDGYDNTTGAARLDWDPTRTFGLDVVARVTDDRVDFDGFTTEIDQFTEGLQEVFLVQPRLSLYDGRWRQRVGMKLTRHDRDTTAEFPSRVRGVLRTLSWQNDVTVNRVHTLVLGLEHEYEQARVNAYESDSTNLAAFGQDSLRLGANGFATVGLRVDRNSAYGTVTTYRVTGGYALRSGTTLRGSVGTGFKAPSLTELDPLAGNPDLEPERSRGFDLGLDQGLAGGDVLFGVTWFDNRFDDLIVPVYDPATGSFPGLNIDRARASGIESYVHARPLERTSVDATYTFTDSEALGTPAAFGLVEGAPLLRRPRHKASLDVAERLFSDRLELVLGGLYVGSRADIDPVTFVTTRADEYVLFRLAANWTPVPWMRVTARIENLLDEEYEDTLGFGTPGRSGFAGVAFRLGS